jgi:23S rRNA pseudouridine1911/1915/1917 synthase
MPRRPKEAGPLAAPPEPPPTDASWTVPPELDKRPLDAAVRLLGELTWGQARQLIATGKVLLAEEIVTSGTRPVRTGQQISLRLRAPRPAVARAMQAESSLVVYVDASVVVVRKPPGMSTIAFGDESPEDQSRTLDVLVRDVVARRDRIRGRAPLGVVHRLDKTTSGLLVFTRTLAAKKHLSAQFREHSVHRVYQAIAHGQVRASTQRSYLVADRGDGLRGTARPGAREGQLAITHVEPIEALQGATLVSCRLETGRTHQIRIHLSEAGHPIVGERVYVRGYRDTLLPAGRAMLHAAELGFIHPVTEEELRFSEPPPADFQEMLGLLRRSRESAPG